MSCNNIPLSDFSLAKNTTLIIGQIRNKAYVKKYSNESLKCEPHEGVLWLSPKKYTRTRLIWRLQCDSDS